MQRDGLVGVTGGIARDRSFRQHALAAAVASASLAIVSASLHAQDRTFDAGGDGTNWNSAANWSGDDIPNTAAENALIDAGGAFNVTLNGNFTIGNLTVGSDDSLSFNTSQILTLQGDTLSNAGLIDMNYTSGGFTDLRIEQGSITLSGGGIIDMVASTRILGALPTDELIIANQTIRGSGGIGGNILKLTNQANGLIDANIATPGNPLLIDPGSGNMTNAGIMQASNGGTLTLFGGTGSYNNTGGTIQALNGSLVSLLSDVSITGGTLDTDGNGVIQSSGSVDTHLDGVTNAGLFVVGDNSDLDVYNTITNSGNIRLAGNPNASELVLQTDNVTFNGGGTLTLDNASGGAIIRDDSSVHRITLDNQTVQGAGAFGQDSIVINLNSNGVINANLAGRTLLVDPTMTAANDGGAVGLTNSGGLLQATNGGNLSLGGGTYTNSGVIQASGANSTVTLENVSNIVGGTVQSVSGGLVQTAISGSAFLESLTINGQIHVRDNSDLNLAGSINNTGNILLDSGVNAARLIMNSNNVTLTGGGTVSLNDDTGVAYIMDVSGMRRLTLGNQTLQGAGNIGVNQIVFTLNSGAVINANLAGRTLLVDPVMSAPDDGGLTGLTNNGGLLQATNGATLGLGGGTFTNNAAGIIQATGANSIVQLNEGATVVGGTLQSSSGGLVQTNISVDTYLDALTVNGQIHVRDNADLNLSNAINNTGDLLLDSAVNAARLVLQTNNVTLTGGGTVTLNDDTGGAIISDDSGERRLTIDNQTLRGAGNIGINTIVMTLNSNAVINANLNARTLVVDPTMNSANDGGAVGLTNNGGLLQATNGGILSLGGGTYANNAAGIIQATGTNSIVQLNEGARIVGGTLQSLSGGLVQTAVSSNAFLDGLTVNGQIHVRDNSDLQLSNSITNTGDILLDSASNAARLIMDTDTVTLGGGGTVTLNDDTGGAIISDESGERRLTLNNQTVRGAGNIGINTMVMTLNANAVINANLSGRTLLIDPVMSAPNDGGPTGLTNNGGLIQATNGANLTLGGADYANSGTIQADGANSTVTLEQSSNVVGGTLQSINGGLVRTGFSVDAYLSGLTFNGQLVIRDNSDLNLSNTITNTGDIGFAGGPNSAEIVLQTNTVIMDGGGTVTLNDTAGAAIVRDDSGTRRLTLNNQTVRGSGNLGANAIVLTVNANGLIDANVLNRTLLVDPTTSAPGDGGSSGLVSAGILRASQGGTLQLAPASYTNNGTFEALDDSDLTMDSTAVLTNNASGTLTGGTYRAVSTGNAATMTLRGSSIGTIAANTTVELSGAPANIQVAATSLASSLITNNGTLKLYNGHAFNMTNALTNNASVELGGLGLNNATLNSGGNITNSATGTIFGHGTITDTILNHGIVRAENGTLTMSGGVIDGQSGTIEITSGSSLDLSSAGGDSDTDYLIHDGVDLLLGSNNVIVRKDYTNNGFGLGDAFAPRFNVSGSGSINASPALSQSVNGDVTDGGTALPILSFGNVRVGANVTKNYGVSTTTAGETTLRGAIQTSVNGANVTDARLSGSGVTAGNFVVAPNSSTASYGVTFNASSSGALTAQKVHVINNFDNVAEQTLAITGAAYNPAVLDVVPPSVDLGDFHVGDPSASQNLTITNNASPDVFSEDLLVNNFAADGDAAFSGPPSILIVAGGSDNTAGGSITFASAGAKNGNITFDAYTNATVNNVAIPDLSAELLGSSSVNYTATVYRLAQPSVPATVNLGEFHVGGSTITNITVGNSAAADGYSEVLFAEVDSFTGDITSASGSTPINPQSNSGALLTAALDISSGGSKSGNVNFNLTSLGAGTLSDTPLSGQSTTVSASVYRLAAPQILNTPPIQFGIVHVGDSITQVALNIKNNAINDAFSEDLDVTAGPHDVGVVGGGSINNLGPQSTDNSSLMVGIATGAAANINGNYVVNFASDGSGINSLGTTLLGSPTIAVIGQVNNYADTEFAKTAGDGTLTENTEASYTLDLGTVFQNDPDPSMQLKLTNDIPNFQPGDFLSGDWLLNAPDFILSGFTAFFPVAAGADLTGLAVTLDTSTVGNFTGTITLQPTGSNPGGYSAALPDVVINLTGNVVAVPEPASIALLSLAGLLAARRRRF